jgi:DtxR family transcriptional regulator, Mn-dependent transcriptional regulator
MSNSSNTLSASLENYLEVIYNLIEKNRVARSKEIASKLEINRSSVTGGLQALRDRGLINYEPYEFITLTDEGRRIAANVVHRHNTLKEFFVNVLSIDEAEAEEAACRMEHGISKNITNRLMDFAHYFKICPNAGVKWVEGIGYTCSPECRKEDEERCQKCQAETSAGQHLSHFAGSAGNMRMTTLKELHPGEKGIIESIVGNSAIKRRIKDMGVTNGTLIEVIRVAPMGDPIEVKVKDYHLSLRKDEAADIIVHGPVK